MALASVVAAASGYLVLVVVARRISPAENADFLVYWSLLFTVFAVMGGLQQEATRTVGSAELRSSTGPGARVLPWSLLMGVGVALLVAAASPWWLPATLGREAPAVLVPLVCIGTVLFAGHVTIVGALAGLRRWMTSATLIGGEAALRLVLVGLVAVLGYGVLGLEVAVAASTVFWLAMAVLSASLRRGAAASGDVPPRGLVVRDAQAMLAAVGSAVLIVGFPTLLRLSSNSVEWSTAAPLVLAISLTRAPLLIPLGAFQGVAIGFFLDPTRNRAAALLKVVGVVTAVGVAGAALAGLVGPWLMESFFGPAYRVRGETLAALTLAAVSLAVLTVTGAGVLALGRHLVYASGWLIAATVSVGLLLWPAPLTTRALLSLAVGPIVGIAVHVIAVLGGARRARTHAPADGQRA
jgi:O-antigen/teichoic acid export membrane protein